LLCRPTPRPFHGWRRLVLRAFGAAVGRECHIYPRARIWAPWNLTCGDYASVADDAEIYNPARVELGEFSIVSQGAYLCGASHDYRSPGFELVSKPIVVGKRAWVAARAIVLLGVSLGEGCVIAAGSVVTRDMPGWTLCAGNPCVPVRPYRPKTEDVGLG